MTDIFNPARLSRWPTHDQAQIDAVTRVLRSGATNYWTGDECRAFEREFASYCRMPHAVSVANGTVALELALRALGIGPGDEVIVPACSFVATASAVVALGAVPVFADVSVTSQTITAQTIADCLTARSRAVIAVHLNGCPCPMDELVDLAGSSNLLLIEDCAQAHGAKWAGKPVGGFGAAATFSFCHDKIMSTGGEGGMVLFADEVSWRRAWSYKDHGKNPEVLGRRGPARGYRWVHDRPGSNLRLTEMQAAIGRTQLRQLDDWVRRRGEIAAAMLGQLGGCAVLQMPAVPDDATHAWYRLPLLVRKDHLRPGWDRDRILAVWHERGVPCLAGGCPELYLEQSLEHFAPRRRRPGATQIGRSGISLTMNPLRSEAEVDWLCRTIWETLQDCVTA